MKLELDDLDLKPEHRSCNASKTSFDKFLPEVQDAILAVGRAVYYSGGRGVYKAISPPKDSHEQFRVGDIVYWNGRRTRESDLPDLKVRFGQGPFRVLGIAAKHLRHGYDHPHSLTIAKPDCVGTFGKLGELPADLLTKNPSKS